jgi:hypothetical protein
MFISKNQKPIRNWYIYVFFSLSLANLPVCLFTRDMHMELVSGRKFKLSSICLSCTADEIAIPVYRPQRKAQKVLLDFPFVPCIGREYPFGAPANKSRNSNAHWIGTQAK